jgi:hypothetical protein
MGLKELRKSLHGGYMLLFFRFEHGQVRLVDHSEASEEILDRVSEISKKQFTTGELMISRGVLGA